MIYLLVFLLLIILSFHYDINGGKNGHAFWSYGVIVVFILIAGLRWRLGSDTPRYINTFYYETPLLSDFLNKELPLKNILWSLLNSLVLTVGGKFFVVQIIQSAFVNILYFKYIKRHSRYVFTCLLLYFIWMYTNQNMETMKASMAIVVGLFGNDYILEKKWLKGYSLFFLACLFHISAIVLIITPLIKNFRFNSKLIIILFLAYILGNIIQSVAGDYLAYLEFNEEIYERVEMYMDSERYMSSRNLNFFIVNMFPFFIYSYFSYLYLSKNKVDEGLMKLVPFVIMGLIFLMFRLNVTLFYRYIYFYNIYFVIFYAEVIIVMIRRRYLIKNNANIIGVFMLFLPMFLVMAKYNYSRREMYYPYSSVFNREINEERESTYMNMALFYAVPNKNEY